MVCPTLLHLRPKVCPYFLTTTYPSSKKNKYSSNFLSSPHLYIHLEFLSFAYYWIGKECAGHFECYVLPINVYHYHSERTYLRNKDNINSVANYSWSSNQNAEVMMTRTSVCLVHLSPSYPNTQQSSALIKKMCWKKGVHEWLPYFLG